MAGKPKEWLEEERFSSYEIAGEPREPRVELRKIEPGALSPKVFQLENRALSLQWDTRALLRSSLDNI
jgi:hypothetical protein